MTFRQYYAVLDSLPLLQLSRVLKAFLFSSWSTEVLLLYSKILEIKVGKALFARDQTEVIMLTDKSCIYFTFLCALESIKMRMTEQSCAASFEKSLKSLEDKK